VAWYGTLAAVTALARQPADARRAWLGRLRVWLPPALAAGALSVAALLIWVAVFSLPDGRLRVTFFNVGQGDAIFLRSPRGHQILVDGGPSPSALLEGLGRTMPYWDRSLDLVVLSHADEDHLTGLIPVVERYHVARAMAPTLPGESKLAEEWQDLLRRRQVPLVVGQRDVRLELEDGVLLEVLHPGPEPLRGAASDNNNSLVLRVAFGRASFLLSGDLEQAGERDLLQTQLPFKSWALKVSHHGAAGGTSGPFLAAAAPELAIISVGEDNHFGHPAPEVLSRLEASGATVLRTDQRGDIEVITDGDQVWIRTEH
jgi:competence protein ComEC